MISGVCAAEFDLIKGCVITGIYPSTDINENLLSSYMIPDGVHKITQDYFFFKMPSANLISQDEINENLQGVDIKLFIFENSLNLWKQFHEIDQVFQMRLNQTHKTLQFMKEDQQILEFKLNECQSLIIAEDFIRITVNQSQFGVQFINPPFRKTILFLQDALKYLHEKIETYFYFYCIIQNKRDNQIKRGSLIRSIAIYSNEYQFFTQQNSILQPYLQKYMDLVDVEHWTNVNALDLSRLKVRQILKSTYDDINVACKIDIEQLKMPLNLFLNEQYLAQNHSYLYTEQQLLKRKLWNFSKQPSLINLISVFGQKTSLIYRALLNFQRILFIAHDTSNNNIQNQQLLYSGACDLACACAYLVYPLNIFSRIQGYQSIIDLRWTEIPGYITVVSNPFFESRKDWYDICCDIITGQIYESNPPQNDSQTNQEYFEKVNKMIVNHQVDEKSLKKLFCQFTIYQLDSSKQDFLLFSAYEKIQTSKIFGIQKLNQILKSIELIQNQDVISEIDLLLFYQTILNNLNSQDRLNEYIKIYLKFQCKYDSLLVGLFSSNKKVVEKCTQVVDIFEKYYQGQCFLKKINYMYLCMLQTQKHTNNQELQGL